VQLSAMGRQRCSAVMAMAVQSRGHVCILVIYTLMCCIKLCSLEVTCNSFSQLCLCVVHSIKLCSRSCTGYTSIVTFFAGLALFYLLVMSRPLLWSALEWDSHTH
jgi:hypothetical protein